VNEWNRLQCALLFSFPSREARAFSSCTLSSTVHKHAGALRTSGSEILYLRFISSTTLAREWVINNAIVELKNKKANTRVWSTGLKPSRRFSLLSKHGRQHLFRYCRIGHLSWPAGFRKEWLGEFFIYLYLLYYYFIISVKGNVSV